MQNAGSGQLGIKVSGWLWGIAVAGTAAVLLVLYTVPVSFQTHRSMEKILFAGWALGPPAWFILQYWAWPPTPAEQERYHLHQGLLKAVWAGVAALLAAMFFGRWPG